MDRLTIYYTSDTHGYLYPTDFISDAPKPMGLLGMAFPKDENTLVIDGGDTLQGSPLTFYCKQNALLPSLADALNAHAYDFVTLGNHDFNYGVPILAEYLKRLNAHCLCANVSDARLPLAPCEVRVMGNGLRVGLVGMTTSWINRWEKPENIAGTEISDPLSAARAAVTAVKAMGCDVLIGIYHGGVERDLATDRLLSDTDENIACRICDELPFDLLLTGHQHIAITNGKRHNTHIVQTPCNALQYARVTLDDAGAFHSELLSPSASPELTRDERELYARLTDWLGRPIGHLSRAIWPGDRLEMALHGSPIADFFNLVQLSASGADVSCTSLANDVRGFASDVTVRDVVASYPYANTLVVLEVSGAILRAALEQCATYFDVSSDGDVQIAEPFLRPKAAHYNYDFFSGIEYEYDLRRPIGQRVSRLTRNGHAVRDDDSLTLCMNNYRATGAGGFDFYLRCPRTEIPIEVSELILNELSAHTIIEIPDSAPFDTVLPQPFRG